MKRTRDGERGGQTETTTTTTTVATTVEIPETAASAAAAAAAADGTQMLRLRCPSSEDVVECRVIEGRGRALVAVAAVKKGESFLSERPVAAVQAVASAGRFMACAHCLAPAGTRVEHHLALAVGSASRRDLIAAAAAAAGDSRQHQARLRLPNVPPLPSACPGGDGGEGDGGAGEGWRGAVPCRRSRGGCTDVFCTEACRTAADGWHSLLCVGGCGEGSPIYEFRQHAMRTHESFMLAADAMARALANEGASDGAVDGDRKQRDRGEKEKDEKEKVHRGDQTAAAGTATSAQALASLFAPAMPWWDAAARTATASASSVAPYGSPTAPATAPASKVPTPKEARKLRRRSEMLREQLEDAWQLLEMAWVHARGLKTAVHLAPLLTFDAFARLVAAVDNTVLPLEGEHPGCGYARGATAEEAKVAGEACAALGTVLRAAEEAAEEAANGGGGGSEDEEEEGSDDEGSDDDSDDEDSDSGDGGDESSSDDNEEGDEDEVEEERGTRTEGRSRAGWIDRAAPAVQCVREAVASGGGGEESLGGGEESRRGGGGRGDCAHWSDLPEENAPAPPPPPAEGILDIVERAATALPRFAGLALAPGVALANHSCLPNCQVESSHTPVSGGSEDKGDDGGGGGDCGGLRVTLVALRDISHGEELTISYVSVTQPLEARRHELAARHRFHCECTRCAAEEAFLPREHGGDGGGARGLPPRLTASELRCLADQAQEEARYDDAERAALAALAMDPADGDAAHKVGTALLGQGRWAAAHAAWRRGVEAAPLHPDLSAQAAKDAAYRPGIVQHTLSAMTSSLPQPLPFETLHPAGVWSSTTTGAMPLLNEAECTAWVAAAEAAAATRGGWTTSRHYAVPTTDIPIHAIPALLSRWNALMRDKLAPLLAAACPQEVRGAQRVRVHDAFVVRYSAAAQHHLPTHADQSLLSVTLALNALGEYEGGGTVFSELFEAKLQTSTLRDVGGAGEVDRRGGGAAGEAARSSVRLVARPGVGHAVAFRGQLQHGGAPVTAGIRYIVAAFLFVE